MRRHRSRARRQIMRELDRLLDQVQRCGGNRPGEGHQTRSKHGRATS